MIEDREDRDVTAETIERTVPATPTESAAHLHHLEVVLAALLLGRKGRRLSLTVAQLNRVSGVRVAIVVGPSGFEAWIDEPDPAMRPGVLYMPTPEGGPRRG